MSDQVALGAHAPVLQEGLCLENWGCFKIYENLETSHLEKKRGIDVSGSNEAARWSGRKSHARRLPAESRCP